MRHENTTEHTAAEIRETLEAWLDNGAELTCPDGGMVAADWGACEGGPGTTLRGLEWLDGASEEELEWMWRDGLAQMEDDDE